MHALTQPLHAMVAEKRGRKPGTPKTKQPAMAKKSRRVRSPTPYSPKPASPQLSGSAAEEADDPEAAAEERELEESREAMGNSVSPSSKPGSESSG